jgi:hypothetical protein
MLRSTLLLRTTTRRIYHGRTHIRCFARKTYEDMEGKVDEALEQQQLQSFAKGVKMGAIKEVSPDEMELLNSESYAELSDGDDDDDDGEDGDDKTGADEQGGENAPDFDAVEDVHERFANMKGRMWVDPWVIDDEHFTRKESLEDLPDWVPSMASRISQERVQLYQGGKRPNTCNRSRCNDADSKHAVSLQTFDLSHNDVLFRNSNPGTTGQSPSPDSRTPQSRSGQRSSWTNGGGGIRKVESAPTGKVPGEKGARKGRTRSQENFGSQVVG